jgi:Na+-translocating ferredoxin:NAD+ oxidoreductase RnfG subunit
MRGAAKRQVIGWCLCLVLWVREGSLAVRSIWAAEPPAIVEHSYEIFEAYLTVEEALQLVFPSSERIVSETVRLTDDQAARVGKLADHPLWEETFTVYKGLTGNQVDGYAVVTEEIGRFHFITFMVGVNPDGTVKRVDVLVYRESRGGEVRHRRFLHQFDGKSLEDPIRLNRDLLNITGATLSVRAMSRGVRKVLGVVRETYGGR